MTWPTAVPAINLRNIRLVADIIEPHITNEYKRRERAESSAQDLTRAGLLADGQPADTDTIRDHAAAVLQCRYNWPTAEKIAAELAESGLLRGGDAR